MPQEQYHTCLRFFLICGRTLYILVVTSASTRHCVQLVRSYEDVPCYRHNNFWKCPSLRMLRKADGPVWQRRKSATVCGQPSQVVTPYTRVFGLYCCIAGRGREPLTQDGQSRTELVHSDVRTAHTTLSCEGRAAMKYTVVIDRWTGRSAVSPRRPEREKKLGRIRKGGWKDKKS